VAMGETGTDVARETRTCAYGRQLHVCGRGRAGGRKIFDNLKKGVSYYLSVKVALVFSFLVALALTLPFPFSPIQIILLELFMDLEHRYFRGRTGGAGRHAKAAKGQECRLHRPAMLANIYLGSICLAAAILINYLFIVYTEAVLCSPRALPSARGSSPHLPRSHHAVAAGAALEDRLDHQQDYAVWEQERSFSW